MSIGYLADAASTFCQLWIISFSAAIRNENSKGKINAIESLKILFIYSILDAYIYMSFDYERYIMRVNFSRKAILIYHFRPLDLP